MKVPVALHSCICSVALLVPVLCSPLSLTISLIALRPPSFPRQPLVFPGGTTATTAIVADNYLAVAWVGDSRAVLCCEAFCMSHCTCSSCTGVGRFPRTHVPLGFDSSKKKKGLDEDCNITATDLTRDHNVVCTNANRTQNTLVLPSPPTVSLTCVRCDGVVQSSNASERQRAESRGGVTVGKYVAVDGAEGLSLSLTRAVYA